MHEVQSKTLEINRNKIWYISIIFSVYNEEEDMSVKLELAYFYSDFELL